MSLHPPAGHGSCLSRGPKPAGYDLPLEVLATIPVAAPADVRTLADDFRMAIWDMRQTLNGLEKTHGIALAPGSVVVPRKHKSAVDRACLAYWNRVYGSDLPPA